MAEVKLDTAPEATKGLYNKGIVAMERGNFDYAMDMFEAVLKIEPRLLEVRRLLRAAAVKHTRNAPAGKITLAKNAGKLMKATSRMKKEPMLALELSEQLLRIDPLNTTFYKLQCDAALAADMPEVAIMTLEVIRDKKEPSIAILESLAERYRQAERFADEYECRTKIAELNPQDGGAQKNLKDAAARLTMGKAGWKKAETFRDVMRDESAPINMVDELERAKDHVAAEPENADLWKMLADVQLKNKLYREAVETLEHCASIENTPDPRVKQKLQTAREQLLITELAEAEDAHDTSRIQAMREKLNAFRIEHAASKTEQYPNDLQLKFEYGKLLYENGQFTEAIQQFQHAQRNPQRRVRSLLYLAKAFQEKNQPEIAMEKLQSALQDLPGMDETKKELLYEAALLCEKMEQKDTAQHYLKEIYAVDIGYRDVANRIEYTENLS